MPYTTYKTNKNCYLYDRTENEIVKISEHDYKILNAIQSGIESEDSKKLLARFRNYGLCEENKFEVLEHPFSNEISFYMGERMKQVVLQVTQNCNLRCDYCAYSGSYNNRVHSNKRMSLETACKAVDFLFQHSKSITKVIVGFYGGEPLLEFPLIKKVVECVEEKYRGKNVTYSITTNGTVFTEEIVDYFYLKDIEVMVSVDGPKEVHNKQRRFVSGEGSFDKVIENLNAVKSKYPEYYKKWNTNTVITPEQGYKCVEDFIENDDIMQSLISKVGLLSDVGLKSIVIYDEHVLVEQKKEELRQMLCLLSEIDDTKSNKLFGDYLEALEKIFTSTLSKAGFSKKGLPGGPCIAGAMRAFVDVDGNIYPCEKVNECEEMIVGNINEDFYIDKVLELTNIAKSTENECKNCWAFTFCTSCIAASIDDKGISKEKRLQKCDGVKMAVLRQMRDMTLLQEYGYDFNRQLLKEKIS